ncbi:MAG: cadherin repeat domain-containing protein, partial [Gemmataceae bacterium]
TYTWMNVSIQQSQQVVLSKPLAATPGATPALTFYNPISASDVTFSIYDSAFLPLSWLDGQVTNGWKEPNTAPKFSGLLTAGTVAPSALAGTVIHTEVATDNDLLAINRRITYDLKRGLADDARLLRINPATGQVMLRYDASHFPRQSYNFTVVATDGGGLSVEKTIRVRVGGN